MTLEKAVHTALDNALDNGYDQTNDDPEDVVSDLREFDSDLEDSSDAEILPHVKTWQAARKK